MRGLAAAAVGVAALALGIESGCTPGHARPATGSEQGKLPDDHRWQDQAKWARAIAYAIRSKLAADAVPVAPAFVRLTLARDGVIEKATLVQSSGSDDYDRSVMATVDRASPLPPPEDAATFDPKITLCLPANMCPGGGPRR